MNTMLNCDEPAFQTNVEPRFSALMGEAALGSTSALPLFDGDVVAPIFERAREITLHLDESTVFPIGGAREVEESAPASGGAVDEDSLKLWWKRVHTYPLLTGEREVALAKRIAQGDRDAEQEMIECNLRLVASIARKCRKTNNGTLSLADLVQEGSVGLIRAVHKFDGRKGYKFSTYASYWIRQAILRAIDEQSRSIRLPVYVLETVMKTERARVILTQKLQRAPSSRELAMSVSLPSHKLQELHNRVAEPLSLDSSFGDEDDSTLCDFIEDSTSPSPVDCAMRASLRSELKRAFEGLPKREVEVLSLRYGLDDGGHARTLDEVGALMNLTRERIRQIEKSAFRQLQKSKPLRETARDFSLLAESHATKSA